MAAGSTYTPIATQTLTSAQSSVTFSSISGSYTDLIICTNAGSVTTNAAIKLQVGNGSIDTGSNYSVTYLLGNGVGAPGSGRLTNQSGTFGSRLESTLIANGFFYLQNYSNTTTYKTVLSRGNAANEMTVAYVGLWRATSAINIITMTSENASNFIAGSTFTLYGIAAA
jgi:hypothetical protein